MAALIEHDDCTCPDPTKRWDPHTTGIDTSVSLTDIRWLLADESCPVERRNLQRIINKRLAARG